MQKYHDAVRYLHDLDSRPREPFHAYVDEQGIKVVGVGLKRIQMLLELAGHPQIGLPIINVAGTSGKGSVCRMLHCIYHAAGKTVGTFYSPPLTTEIERIEVNEQLIAPDEFVTLTEWAKPLIEEVAGMDGYDAPSSFEVTVLMALQYFRDMQCDIVILEAGLGGTYDACNIADTQVAAVVTTVGLDHVHILGDTKEQIALDKAGILKEKGRLFTADRDMSVLKVLEAVALQKDAIFFPIVETPHVLHSDIHGSRFGFGGCTIDLHVGGKHQMDNAAIAYMVTNMLAVDRADIERGLLNFRMAGRSEVVQDKPFVILDGAHNVDKISALVKFCADQRVVPLNVVFGAMADKDVDHMLELLKPITKKLYPVPIRCTPRPSMLPHEIAKHANQLGMTTESYDTARAGLDAAMADGPTLVTGSLHLIGELRQKWYSEAGILEHRVMTW